MHIINMIKLINVNIVLIGATVFVFTVDVDKLGFSEI